jgi:hypothetical protein
VIQNLHPACIACRKNNVAKEDLVDSESGKVIAKKGEFAIRCDGIPLDPVRAIKESLPDVLLSELTEEEVEKFALIEDPVIWAHSNLLVPDPETREKNPWEPRGATPENVEKYGLPEDALYYQDLIVRCTAKRQVLRLGRRSGKTWSVMTKVLHKMYTNEGYRVLIITPNISQLDLIFDQAREFIATSPTLNSDQIRSVKTPQRFIQLPNGSYMRGFVSGNESIRGQACDMLIIDEADYLTTSDLSGVMAIISEHKDTIFIVASTPSGAREQFYKWDHDPNYRSFHYPSMCRPNWDSNMEMEQRRENPGLKYIREVLAEYGELGQGVFQIEFVESAIRSSTRYEANEPKPGWVYAIGVDWNPVNGTETYVVGMDLDSREKFTVDKGRVFREGRTQIDSVNEIIRLNRKWNPFAIFCDQGAGAHQIEYLEAAGESSAPGSADARLTNIVRGIDFGSNIEYHHPTTGEKKKEYAKGLIVDNAVRLFEQGQVVLSAHDQELVRQLKGYIIKKMNGRKPVFGMVNDTIQDHALDAFLLALFAFEVHYTSFGDFPTISTVGFAWSNQAAIATGKAEDNRPKVRSWTQEEEKQENLLERSKGYLLTSEIRESSGLNVSRSHVGVPLSKIHGRNFSTPTRSPIQRSSISTRRGRI